MKQIEMNDNTSAQPKGAQQSACSATISVPADWPDSEAIHRIAQYPVPGTQAKFTPSPEDTQ